MQEELNSKKPGDAMSVSVIYGTTGQQESGEA